MLGTKWHCIFSKPTAKSIVSFRKFGSFHNHYFYTEICLLNQTKQIKLYQPSIFLNFHLNKQTLNPHLKRCLCIYVFPKYSYFNKFFTLYSPTVSQKFFFCVFLFYVTVRNSNSRNTRRKSIAMSTVTRKSAHYLVTITVIT